MPMTAALHPLAHFLALRVIQSLGEGSLLGLCAALVLRVSRQNAGTRFAVWFSSLMAIAVLPLISAQRLWHSTAESASRAAITLPDSWALYVFALWLAFAGWFLLGVARALWHLRALRKSCIAIDPAMLDPALQETLQRHHMNRRVLLCTSARVRVPTAIGLLKPAVVIPDWVMQELSTEELNQILLHELAHLRRWDDWTNLAQQVVRALFFFHPVVWWMEKKASLEREIACDDAVLAETASPRAYAECLARLAEKSFLHRNLALAQAALGRIRQTTLRVTQILDPNRPTSQRRALMPAVSGVAVLAIACGLSVARGPRLIAFEDGTPVRVTSPVASSSGTNAATSSTTSDAKAYPALVRSHEAEITRAKLNLGPVYPNLLAHAASARLRSVTSRPRAEQTVRLTSSSATPVPFTETLFVVIENRGADSADRPVFQIQLWRVMVLRTVVDPATTQIPRKET